MWLGNLSKKSISGYSPDGVVLNENGQPTKLLEIKCPYKDNIIVVYKI